MNSSFKYPRTPHMPFSPGYSYDDDQLVDLTHFEGKAVVVTEKMDGENTSLYKTHWHARGLDSRRKHVSRDWIANYWSQYSGEIPDGWRICGENLYAKHSLLYTNLYSFFLGFSVWNEDNNALSWEKTVDFFAQHGINSVPVLFHGKFSLEMLTYVASKIDTTKQEGFVLRVADQIPYKSFAQSVCKWVRVDHVSPDAKHWFSSKVVRNVLCTDT
jgi:ATP-dependent RNA circularization protein (DNA/RNA ligase family)